ncbi:hypothetical protein J6590_044248 [Homalodisca vitripennis]|nr:hypothetical protein J6590_044248 [Homalodisca vitripennis]
MFTSHPRVRSDRRAMACLGTGCGDRAIEYAEASAFIVSSPQTKLELRPYSNLNTASIPAAETMPDIHSQKRRIRYKKENRRDDSGWPRVLGRSARPAGR